MTACRRPLCAVMRRLDECATARVEVYRDTRDDRPDGSLEKAGRLSHGRLELRPA
ncbi:hypothetical protein P1P75_17005 [Streptomyces sp. ID05-39B]|uniref:hypothetical protein n=1 Tax=Streptomyces sp. ID05-39B TaxID=3028664 RepID=UPI0029AA9B82|nr:hypothetical protein [Streptomyces sp. ID05-39B]MDX3528088.1 hypothetical protein [Streptomyces sp. ID05-39B]